MLTKERLEQVLRGLDVTPLDVRVEGRPGHFVGFLVSPAFQGERDGTRQVRVWDYLLKALTDFERRDVEFVFTSTPEEAGLPSGDSTHA